MSADDEEELSERCEELAHELLGPLVLGGTVNPVRPFGGPLALRIGKAGSEGRRILDAELATRLDVARVRRARVIAAVDTLPELDAGDWAVLAALNDLLQLTNHKLASAITRGRYKALAANLAWLLERIPPPRDVLAALSRHATFARALELARTDSAVSWWTGSARFRGERPPARLLAWKEIRRVHVDERRVLLAEMPAGATGTAPLEFTDLLALWLTRSPLTDIATATRSSPPFAWSAATLSLIAVPSGRSLAFRALVAERPAAVAAVLAKASQQVPSKYEEARRLAEGFQARVVSSFEELYGAAT